MKRNHLCGIIRSGVLLLVTMLALCMMNIPCISYGQTLPGSDLTDKDNKSLQKMCDEHAENNIEELANSLERLRTEMAAAKCSYEEIMGKMSASQRMALLGYLVGPYYEWEGTSTPCAVRIRIIGDEVHACSLRGASSDGKTEHRNVYRLNIKTLEVLPSMRGQCGGIGIGDPEVADCSESSALNPKDCSLVKPAGRKCKQILEEMRKNR